MAREKGRPGKPGSQEASERLARERAEREAYIAKMKEQVNVISSNVYGMALQQLEANVEYERGKLERFEQRLTEIQKNYKACFSD